MGWSKATWVAFALAIMIITSLLIHDLITSAMYISLLESQKDLKEGYESLLSDHRRLLNEFAELKRERSDLEARLASLSASYEALAASYKALSQNYTALEGEYEKVLAAYIECTVAYASLNETFWGLRAEYEAFRKEASGYTELKKTYEALFDSYQKLCADYSRIKAEYDRLYATVYRPLLNVETPTLEELKKWLAEDDTDKLPYRPKNFTCGDFAVMLHTRAKLRNWDMGIVVVHGILSDGSKFMHVFNAIRCKEGLVYIEPQNDSIFNKVSMIYNHPGFGTVYVNEILIIVPYQEK